MLKPMRFQELNPWTPSTRGVESPTLTSCENGTNWEFITKWGWNHRWTVHGMRIYCEITSNQGGGEWEGCGPFPHFWWQSGEMSHSGELIYNWWKHGLYGGNGTNWEFFTKLCEFYPQKQVSWAFKALKPLSFWGLKLQFNIITNMLRHNL